MSKKALIAHILGTLAICVSLIVIIRDTNRSRDQFLGPHRTYIWTEDYFLSLDGEYRLMGESYFQLHQEGQPPVQSLYREPQLGENHGFYIIDRVRLTGTWAISGPAEIFSFEETSNIITPTPDEKLEDSFLLTLVAICIWIIFFMLILKYS